MFKFRQEIFETYWQFAAKRQEVFFRKLAGLNPPFTDDAILNYYKFCNVYRVNDRVSQYLIKQIIYGNSHSTEDTLFRIFFFRLLNKIDTWILLEQKIGDINLKTFSIQKYAQALEEIKAIQPIYGNAFILCANKVFGFDQKHLNHLALLEKVFTQENLAQKLLKAKSLKQVFEKLRDLPLIGNFMAYQITIDLNYSPFINFDENDFAIPGPGALRGIQKCFIDTDNKSGEYIIQFMVENQDKEFKRLGLEFKNLFGRKMKAIDCQGWFCETDKYCRAKFPELKSNRQKIKTVYKPVQEKIEYFYPPKWRLID